MMCVYKQDICSRLYVLMKKIKAFEYASFLFDLKL
jgi:hypothetical protein